VVVTIAPLPAVDGLLPGYRWLLRDITPGKRTQQALSAERSFSDLLVDTAQVIILVVDAGGHVVRSNPFLTAVSGYAPEELLGQDWCDLLVGGRTAGAPATSS
jgi:PAS domain-containing protein